MKNYSSQTIQPHVKSGSTVIIGVSGGPDSVFLLDLCVKLQKKHPFKIIVAHLDHNLRKNSAKDEKFVKKLASLNKLTYETKKLHKVKATDGNLEETFRKYRYAFFEELRKKYKADWILTAHHLNDNLETVLMNFIRGSSIEGLAGMNTMDEKRHLLRPLLNLSKHEIIDYLKQNKIKYVIDETNTSTKYTRNLIRLKIIPEMKKVNPNLEQTFSQNIINLQEIKQYLLDKTESFIGKDPTKPILLEKFLKLNPLLQKSVLSYLYKKIHGNTVKFNQNHLNQVLKIIYGKKSKTKKEFGDNYFLCIEKMGEAQQRFIVFKAKT